MLHVDIGKPSLWHRLCSLKLEEPTRPACVNDNATALHLSWAQGSHAGNAGLPDFSRLFIFWGAFSQCPERGSLLSQEAHLAGHSGLANTWHGCLLIACSGLQITTRRALRVAFT